MRRAGTKTASAMCFGSVCVPSIFCCIGLCAIHSAAWMPNWFHVLSSSFDNLTSLTEEFLEQCFPDEDHIPIVIDLREWRSMENFDCKKWHKFGDENDMCDVFSNEPEWMPPVDGVLAIIRVLYEQVGSAPLIIIVLCYYGKHRSVFIASTLRQLLCKP